MPTDAELLHRYAGQKDGRAFAELVQRHLGLVYATALRSTGGRAHLAEEIAQRVFTDLARKAAGLCHHPVLAGWLYRSTRYAAKEASRAELRRQKFNEAVAAMPDVVAPEESPEDWEQLRPVIDGALEELKESDRELVLLRFFQGLTFPEIGARLNLSENAARMRTERVLEKLCGHLGRRGLTSTAALAGLLTSQALVAAPAGLASTVTAAALTTVPASGAVISFLLMSKITVPALGAVLVAGATALVWILTAPGVSAEELAALRAENARLAQAAAAGADTAVADEFAAQAALIVQTVGKRLDEKEAAGGSRHRDHGQATPRDAFLSYAWAMDAGEVTALTRLITFEEEGLASIRAIHAGMPASIRAHYPTPEEFIAFLFVADTLLNPVPDVDVAEEFVATDTGPGRAAVRRRGTTQGGMNFHQTVEGWRCVVPDGYPAHLARRILSNEMLAELGLN